MEKGWVRREGVRCFFLLCVGGLMMVILMFWLGWIVNIFVLWVVFFLLGFLLGFGDLFIFILFLNYLVDLYGIYFVLVMVVFFFICSILGVILFLVSYGIYDKLGIVWVMMLLGSLMLIMFVILFVFMCYFVFICKKSKFC